MLRKLGVRLSLIIWAALCLLGWWENVALSQNSSEWTLPEAISPNSEYSFRPEVTTDQSGAVHVFWISDAVEETSQSSAIFYTRYLDGIWSPPVDIFVSPGGDITQLRALVDTTGRLHLFWLTGELNSPFGPVNYSWAPVGDAGRVGAWQPTRQVAFGTYHGDVAIDPEGRLHLVYASVTDDLGICHISSANDGGANDGGTNDGGTWSDPTCIPRFITHRDQEFDTRPRLAIDSRGTLHVVWVLDDYSPSSFLRYDGRAILYAQSSDNGLSWTDMRVVEEVDGRGADILIDQPEWPNIVVDSEDRVHLVWISGLGHMQRYHQWSEDGGSTWTRPSVAIPVTHYNGRMGLVSDQNGAVYFATAGSEGMTYSRWLRDSGWTPAISFKGEVGGAHYVSMAIALNNELHVIWQNHGNSHGVEFDGDQDGTILHSQLLIGNERNLPQPIPSVPPSLQIPTVQPKPRLIESSQVESRQAESRQVVTPAKPLQVALATPPAHALQPSSPLLIVMISVLPTVVLLAVVALFYSRHH